MVCTLTAQNIGISVYLFLLLFPQLIGVTLPFLFTLLRGFEDELYEWALSQLHYRSKARMHTAVSMEGIYAQVNINFSLASRL